MRKTLLTVIAVMALLFCVEMAQAQGGGGGGAGGGRGGRGGRGGNFDPAAMAQRQLDQVKTQLGATDQEWTVLEPLVSDVLKNQNQGGGRGMMGGRGGMGGGRGGNQQDPNAPNPALAAMQAANPELFALQQAVTSDTATPDEIKAKLAAFRTAQAKKTEALKAAREKLQKVVTVKQEAILVLRGILE